MKFRREFYGRASSIIKDIEDELNYLNWARDRMKSIPSFDLQVPTVVIAGYPNVGKSEIVGKISSTKPEIAPYPFTTKGIILGHLERMGRRIQIVDTPGLLDRPLSERNDIEIQAILALKYLADLIVYVLDPSETCGYPIEEQMNLLNEIRGKFGIDTLVIENKIDLYKSKSDRIKISAKTGENLDMLVSEIWRRLFR